MSLAKYLEDFDAVKRLYDIEMADNVIAHDLIYPHVFGFGGYIGQFSDNSADELLMMAERMGLEPGSEVLDVGCGRGAVAAFFAERLGWKMTGIDLSHTLIADAQRKFKDDLTPSPLHFMHGDIYSLDQTARFDGVYGTGSFCHFDVERLFPKLASLLRPGGVMGFMERIRLGEFSEADWSRLTIEWSCPTVYTLADYDSLARNAGFVDPAMVDLTPSFMVWQRRSVEARKQLKDNIVNRTSDAYFNLSLTLACHENEATSRGLLGYALFTAHTSA
jgi:cyclopropane fatty-acyl-phospholipid synthase-like methyltransferase